MAAELFLLARKKAGDEDLGDGATVAAAAAVFAAPALGQVVPVEQSAACRGRHTQRRIQHLK